MNPTEEQPKSYAPQDCCGSRQSGRGVISDIIHRLRRRADSLEAMSNMLPAQLTPQQDDHLWNIACDMERR